MENASKALLIAGGMLLFIIVLSLAIFIWGRIGKQAAGFYERLEQSDVDEFNEKFTRYEGRGTVKEAGKWVKPLKIQDVVSMINSANDNNQTERMPVNVSVKIISGKDLSGKSTTDILRDKELEDKEFGLYSENIKYNNLGLINEVGITQH